MLFSIYVASEAEAVHPTRYSRRSFRRSPSTDPHHGSVHQAIDSQLTVGKFDKFALTVATATPPCLGCTRKSRNDGDCNLIADGCGEESQQQAPGPSIALLSTAHAARWAVLGTITPKPITFPRQFIHLCGWLLLQARARTLR